MKEDSWYSIHRISTRLFQVVSDFMRDIFLFCLFVFFFTKLRKQTIKVGVSVLQLLSYCYCRCLLKEVYSAFFLFVHVLMHAAAHIMATFLQCSPFSENTAFLSPFFFVFSCLLCAVLCTSGVYLRERRICPTSWWRQIKPVVCPHSLPELGLLKISARRRRSCQSLSCPQKEKSFLLNEQRGRGKRRRF